MMGSNEIIAKLDPQNRAQSGQDIDIVFNLQKMHIFDVNTRETIV